MYSVDLAAQNYCIVALDGSSTQGLHHFLSNFDCSIPDNTLIDESHNPDVYMDRRAKINLQQQNLIRPYFLR